MQPNNGQTPLDYLNQIAPQAPKKPLFELNLRTVIIGALLAIILVIIISVIVSAVTEGNKKPWQQLNARLAITESIANDATTKLKSSQLRSLNSDLKLYLTNTQRDLETPLKQRTITKKTMPPAITTQEASTKMIARLEDGRLNAKFDSTYAREMSYKLATILSLYQELIGKSGSKADQAFLKTSYDNLLPTQEALANFNNSNE